MTVKVKTEKIRNPCGDNSLGIKDKLPKINYEINKLLYILFLPLMDLITIYVLIKKAVYKFFKKIPKTNSCFFDGFSKYLNDIKNGAASWLALALIYNYYKCRNELSEKEIEKRITYFWINMRNAQAVRNRKKIVTAILTNLIKEIYEKNGHKEVFILSIACGSAEAVFDAVVELKLPVRIVLLDKDETALDYCKKEALKSGIKNIQFIHGSTTNFSCYIKKIGNPDIIEMIGLTDYLKEPKAINLFSRINVNIAHGGYFLTGNVSPNSEKWFLWAVINWPMIYRTKKTLAKIVEASGFKNYEIITEPHNIHNIAVCRKNTKNFC